MTAQTSNSASSCLSTDVLTATKTLYESFSQASPFPHIVADNFLNDSLCSALINEFPSFESGNYLNEAGQSGGKSVHETLDEIGPAYKWLDQYFRSREFLDWASKVTRIPKLLFDPHYFGGGTHENKPGQELDVHIDFNRHPITRWYRRLNLLIYLNESWSPEWGGSLELHSNPYGDDKIVDVLPKRNRGVLFETSDHSWHGFRKIDQKIDASISRKSVAIYLYTIDPPAHDNGKIHSTIYVDRPMPGHFIEGHVLSKSDIDSLEFLLDRRDQHIRRLYKEISFHHTANEKLKHALVIIFRKLRLLGLVRWIKNWLTRLNLLPG